MAEPLLISFIGPSGAGKTTCRAFAEQFFLGLGYLTFRMDVAEPLREIQQFAYHSFGKPDPGKTVSDDFTHDGILQGFLAEHFQANLGETFARRYGELYEACFRHKTDALGCVLNADCRNNSYADLRKIGFVFVRIVATNEVVAIRRSQRGDLSPFNRQLVEHTDAIQQHYTIENSGDNLYFLQQSVNALMAEISAKHELRIMLSDS